MCIVSFITQYCPRFPLILIGNRDEVLSRLTHPLAVDGATGLLWSVDGVAGGSWLGLDLAHGRLATVTNCRRAPTAPLLQPLPADAAWRGAAPLEEARQFSSVVDGPDGLPTLNYDPPTSRGTIIRDFLCRGALPGDGDGDGGDAARPRALWPPYYAGYNLLSCDHVLSAAEPITMHYTTNRFGAQRRTPLSHGAVHVLQNTHVDNWAEPKSCLLADRLREALAREVRPLAADAPLDVGRLSSALADHCLCATPQFDLLRMLADIREDPRADAAALAKAAAWEALLASADPLLGWTPGELTADFGLDASPAALEQRQRAERRKEAHLQRNICVPAEGGYGTRVQSVVVVERPSPADPACVVHFAQREVGHVGGLTPEAQHTLSADELFRPGPWKRYAVTSHEARAC
ncbi:hypothetical protein STCU_07284 [Strigomonas culicis]|uniref:Transport and Golgi organization protein 2 n=1 Tax=Strigomonas culicis TaxID=28005 RepID=S9VLZ7_9TRYP|nr:hypothetical protein STCU_07284 [Strigomonas culicis]|eukprot:EPY24230.1 hypothetical protein STCU_07284 [Strigomonas culicis]